MHLEFPVISAEEAAIGCDRGRYQLWPSEVWPSCFYQFWSNQVWPTPHFSFKSGERGPVRVGSSEIRPDGRLVGRQASPRRTRRTLDRLRDPVRHPAEPREPLPHAAWSARPAQAFIVDDHLFLQNLRTSRRGAAAGPSGMNSDRLFPLSDSERDSMKFCEFASFVARGEVLGEIMDVLRMERMTALSKPDGGFRGITVGDVSRRLVSRTVAQQYSKRVEIATAPCQCALSTRVGCECAAHVQTLTGIDEEATVVSIDGVGAFDLISRNAMLQALLRSTVGTRSAFQTTSWTTINILVGRTRRERSDATFVQFGTARMQEELWAHATPQGFTTVRPNSETGVGLSRSGLRSSQLVWWNLAQWCGRVILSCHCPRMGCVFWELQSATQSTSWISWLRSLWNTSCHFRESPQWRTSKQRGCCCCCSVEQHAPISGYAFRGEAR